MRSIALCFTVTAMRPLALLVLSVGLLGCGAESTALAGSPLAARVALIRAVHPAPDRVTTAGELDALVAAEDARWSNGELAASRALRRVLARIGDSHLAGALPALGPDDATLVPFLVKRVGDVYRVDAASVAEIVGDEVLAVEGVPIAELMDRLAALSTVDGDRPRVRLAEAERRFAEHLRLELGDREEWTVVTRAADGTEATRVMPGVPPDALGGLETARRSAAAWGSRAPMPVLDERGDVALLRLATFAPTDREAYLREIEALAPAIARADHLVIDLRGNEGGDRSLGIALARHLLAAPFAQWRGVRARVRAIPEPFASRVRFLFGSVATLEDFPGVPVAEGWRFEGDPLAASMVPAEPAHRGALTLLVDDATNSAAVELAVALLAHHPDVTVVGSETQGECGWHVGQLPIVYEDDAGPALLMSLFGIELVAYPGCRASRGIEPDVPVAYSEDDFRTGRDPHLHRLAR